MIGILFDNKRRLKAFRAVWAARQEFLGAEHTQGITPKVAVFNPAEKPHQKEIWGLRVVADASVAMGRIRICDEVEDVEMVTEVA